jgi:unsaturated chondroitin disaccharide hydrolase
MKSIVSRAFGVSLPLILTLSLATPGARGQCTTQALSLAQQQLTKTLKYIDTSHFPQMTVLNNQGTYSPWNSLAATEWSSGFFPGWIWQMYEQTLDSSLLSRAQAQTASMQGEITDASGHDVGMRIVPSYGNGYEITRDPSYMGAIQTAAQTMSTLYVSFPDGTGTFNSWPYYSSTYTTTIIDNMVTIELLFYAARNGGSPAWYNIAVNHALKTMQNQVRSDGSTYQGVEYNSDGTVHNYFSADGYSTNSTWSRGQAWGIYGFTMTYRYTGNASFLATAQQLANYFISHLPPDHVPYWDFSQSNYKDSSAAAIVASALLELSTYVTEPDKSNYYNAAMNIQNSLSSSFYQGNPLNTDGILLHGTYSPPYNVGIDTSLLWGDYFFIQSCYRAMAPPPQVIGLSAGTVSSNQIPLSWQAQAGAVRYNVKRGTAAGGPYTTIAPPPVLTSNSYTDNGVAPSMTYYYVVSASGVAGEGLNSAEVAVTTPAAPSDFWLSASPASLSVSQSGSTTSNVTVIALGGFSGTVGLSASNTPGGPIGTFSPATIPGSGTSVLTVTASGVPAGTYSLTVTGTSGALVHSGVVTVTVAPGGSLTLTAKPASLTVSKSTSPTAAATIAVTSASGFTGTVTLSVSNLPRGVTATIGPSSVTASPGSPGTATLTVKAVRKASTGPQTVTVTGNSSGVSHATITVPLQINN